MAEMERLVRLTRKLSRDLPGGACCSLWAAPANTAKKLQAPSEAYVTWPELGAPPTRIKQDKAACLHSYMRQRLIANQNKAKLETRSPKALDSITFRFLSNSCWSVSILQTIKKLLEAPYFSKLEAAPSAGRTSGWGWSLDPGLSGINRARPASFLIALSRERLPSRDPNSSQQEAEKGSRCRTPSHRDPIQMLRAREAYRKPEWVTCRGGGVSFLSQ